MFYEFFSALWYLNILICGLVQGFYVGGWGVKAVFHENWAGVTGGRRKQVAGTQYVKSCWMSNEQGKQQVQTMKLYNTNLWPILHFWG